MKILVDAFGGDYAPLSVLQGATLAVSQLGVEVCLVGDKEKIAACAEQNNIDLSALEILQADDVITMHDDPASIVKEKKNSSMAVGLKALTEAKGDAFVSAGSTGALVIGSSLIAKRMKGVKRVCLGSVLPGKNNNFFLLDIGANAECRPEMLQQFAVMGSAYMENVMGVKNPKVGLLNIGTEDTKGGELQKEAYKLLQTGNIHFTGNVEARDVPLGDVDVVVADGFTGNVVLKLIEGVSSSLFSMIKGVLKRSVFTKLAALMLKKGLTEMKSSLDYTEVGGAPLLGCRYPVIKAHGSSNANAIKNAIRQAKIFVETGVNEKIENGLSAENAETKDR